ncbi:tRNA uridine(34) 5-carboxymethylaminomethyl modification radical SAM/GNAT enzyme Elp3 [Candidatus Woesearchaeota archaeon]|nr:tRNA uridine(34) 5-carboxymethylaminomethyl modification radical SAM/GNAT enzyme Elp3 [Candidatus Woesearchaeota archaeon]
MLIASNPSITKQDLALLKKQVAQKHGLNFIPKDEALNAFNPKLGITSKPTRHLSGVTVVAVMTAPFNCPHGKCAYCPGGLNSVFGSTPQSYTGLEPAARRGLMHGYHPYLQVFNRLEQYVLLGWIPQKIEVIVLGGTFPSMPKHYKEWFVGNVFRALNDFSTMFFENTGSKIIFNYEKFQKFQHKRLTLWNLIRANADRVFNFELEKVKNQNSAVRCIGLTLETRPDWGFTSHGLEMLNLGATRVEIGVQSLYDDVLIKVQRGHDVADIKKSFAELRDLGFKINAHVMLGLPGSSFERDVEMFKTLFQDPSFKPDMLKIYPTLVVKGTLLYKCWKTGKYKPLTTDQAVRLIALAKQFIPKWCRVMRVQRDIPTNVIQAGVKASNLRQLVHDYMARHGLKCNCIRCREAPRNLLFKNFEYLLKNSVLNIEKYVASKGLEFFISLEYKPGYDLKIGKHYILGFARLRLLPRNLHPVMTGKTAVVRELHVYGNALALNSKSDKSLQHKGIGKLLMRTAEDIALKHGFEKMLVISGVGVRSYYEKLGYTLEEPYMAKMLV